MSFRLLNEDKIKISAKLNPNHGKNDEQWLRVDFSNIDIAAENDAVVMWKVKGYREINWNYIPFAGVIKSLYYNGDAYCYFPLDSKKVHTKKVKNLVVKGISTTINIGIKWRRAQNGERVPEFFLNADREKNLVDYADLYGQMESANGDDEHVRWVRNVLNSAVLTNKDDKPGWLDFGHYGIKAIRNTLRDFPKNTLNSLVVRYGINFGLKQLTTVIKGIPLLQSFLSSQAPKGIY